MVAAKTLVSMRMAVSRVRLVRGGKRAKMSAQADVVLIPATRRPVFPPFRSHRPALGRSKGGNEEVHAPGLLRALSTAASAVSVPGAFFCLICRALRLPRRLATRMAAAVPGFMLTKSTAGNAEGTLRRVLGTIVGLMLAGSAFGMLGAIVFPERNVNPPPWRDAERRESTAQRARPNSVRSDKPAIKVVVHCNNGRDTGALRDAHHRDGRPSAVAVGGRTVPLIQARCDGPQGGGASRL